jgi:glycerol-3-phosphate dehydrogenase (NAD(P)+)
MHEVADEVLGAQRPLAVISGPTFAREVALGLPTAVTVASAVPEFATALAARLGNNHFRAYTSDDVIGVEVGGAVKNVLAIAAGIADGLGFGANTRAALVTRGLAEMMRLGVVLGGQRETFMGLAGLGDLVLTCTDDQSRNRRVGLALARGQSLAEACRSVQQVAEGVKAAREVQGLAGKHGVEMPITEQVYRVLYDGLDPREAVHALLQREQKAESL